MPSRYQVYKCEICGNVVEMMTGGKGTLVCCGEPMVHREEQTEDYALEKHVPLVEKADGGVKVTVGSTLHPMVAEHYIEWIEAIDGDTSYITFLKPGDEPVAFFPLNDMDGVIVREHCNIHGLWKA